jgi:hypothetical protein
MPKHQALKIEIKLHIFLTRRHSMVVSVQLHAPAALHTGPSLPSPLPHVHTGSQTGLDREPTWT